MTEPRPGADRATSTADEPLIIAEYITANQQLARRLFEAQDEVGRLRADLADVRHRISEAVLRLTAWISWADLAWATSFKDLRDEILSAGDPDEGDGP